MGEGSHLGIEEARGGLDDAYNLIVDTDGEDLVGSSQDGTDEVQANILRLHVEDEGVGKGLLLAGGDGGLVLDSREVAQDGGVGRGVRT